MITLEIKGLDKLQASLRDLASEKVMGAAITSAINKTAASGKTQLSKSVRDVYNIKKGDLDKKIKIRKASQGNHTAVITVSSRPIGLIHFGAKQLKAFDKGKKRYFKTSAKVLNKERKKVYKGAFIAKGKTSNSYQVFRRTTDKRFPIRKMAVISPLSMARRHALDDFVKVFEEKFEKTFFHELEYYLSKAK